MHALIPIELPRVLAAVLGAGLLLGTACYGHARRLRASFPVLFLLLLAAAGLLSMAFFPQAFESLMPDLRLGRIRLAVVVLTIFIMIVTFESIRRTQIKERYALLWVIPCVIILFLTAQPAILDWLRTSFGMEYASTMVAVVFVSVMAAVFVLARSLSVNERNIARLAQRCAMLEARLRELEKGNRE